SNDSCEYRKILAIIFTLFIYILSFYLLFLVYFNNYYNISYPIPFIFIELWILFCIIFVTILSYIFRYGIITQAAFISLYLSFILNNIEYLNSHQLNRLLTKDTSIHLLTSYLLQLF